MKRPHIISIGEVLRDLFPDGERFGGAPATLLLRRWYLAAFAAKHQKSFFKPPARLPHPFAHSPKSYPTLFTCPLTLFDLMKALPIKLLWSLCLFLCLSGFSFAADPEKLTTSIQPKPTYRVKPSERRVFPDNDPKIPKFTFPDDLESQQEALAKNPLLEKFRKAREERSPDPHLPAYHYISPYGKVGDANGLCYWQGNWHLFYQARFPEDNRPYWGHAVSKDLFNWKDLPPGLYPGPERSCFSGSTFVEKDRVIAHYHGAGIGNMVAVSEDPLLLNWEKLTGYAVLPTPPLNPDGSKRYGVFDPCLWKQGDYYYSLSSHTKENEFTGRRFRGARPVPFEGSGELELPPRIQGRRPMEFAG